MLLLTASWPLPFDCYLLKYPTGSSIPEHVDPVEPHANHFRMSIILKHADEGGDFIVKHCLFNTPRIKVFRPDKEPHEVLPVIKGERLVLSIGWKTFKKHLPSKK